MSPLSKSALWCFKWASLEPQRANVPSSVLKLAPWSFSLMFVTFHNVPFISPFLYTLKPTNKFHPDYIVFSCILAYYYSLSSNRSSLPLPSTVVLFVCLDLDFWSRLKQVVNNTATKTTFQILLLERSDFQFPCSLWDQII